MIKKFIDKCLYCDDVVFSFSSSSFQSKCHRSALMTILLILYSDRERSRRKFCIHSMVLLRRPFRLDRQKIVGSAVLQLKWGTCVHVGETLFSLTGLYRRVRRDPFPFYSPLLTPFRILLVPV